VPQLAVRLFTAIVPRPPAEIFAPGVSVPPPASTTRAPPAQKLVRVASVLAVPMVALVLSPYHAHDAAKVVLFVYVG
ncbi:MAG: hypothetical protein ABI175_28140, partial [Polyangiales bacterium]